MDKMAKKRALQYTGPICKYGWPKKVVSVTHGCVILGCKQGEHGITVARDGDLNRGKHHIVKMPFTKAVEKAKETALKMGEHTAVFIHGASENWSEYQVRQGRLVKI
jgi:hypothetical protein